MSNRAVDETVFRQVLTGLADAVVVASADGRVLYANDAALRLFGPDIVYAQRDAWSQRFGIYYPDGAPSTCARSTIFPWCARSAGRSASMRS